MESVSYPEAVAHTRDHARFFEEVSDINQSSLDRHHRILSWVTSYLSDHINTHDRKLVDFCRSHSIKFDSVHKVSRHPPSRIATF